jgi:hypothetical protein
MPASSAVWAVVALAAVPAEVAVSAVSAAVALAAVPAEGTCPRVDVSMLPPLELHGLLLRLAAPVAQRDLALALADDDACARVAYDQPRQCARCQCQRERSPSDSSTPHLHHLRAAFRRSAPGVK